MAAPPKVFLIAPSPVKDVLMKPLTQTTAQAKGTYQSRADEETALLNNIEMLTASNNMKVGV